MNHLFGLVTEMRPEIQVGIGLLIAIAVTVHVLLTKPEVSAAVGWIGLAWFAPFLGGFVYFVLGINRVQRRARRMRGDDGLRSRRRHGQHSRVGDDGHLEPLERGVGVLTERASEPGNSFRVLINGDEAYPEMLAAIADARHSVGLSSYIMRADGAGQRFVDALKAAQDRGVAVRVLVDGVGSGWLTSPAFRLLRKAGLPCGRFMHSLMPWRMPFLNLRMHSKVMIVDGRLGYTGGINIADQNLIRTHPADPVQDTHFRIEGPVVGQLAEVFARDWAFVTDEALEGEAWFPKLAAVGEVVARVVTAGPDQDLEKIEFAILQAVACARTSVRLVTPYFLPGQLLANALSLAAVRGVAVEVVLPQVSDHRLVEWAMHANVGPMLHDGVRIWRCPSPFRHSKMLVIDGAWSLIGSSNWDMRSFRLNFEMCVEVYDTALAEALESLMMEYRGPPLELAELKRRSMSVRLRDAAARLMLPYL